MTPQAAACRASDGLCPLKPCAALNGVSQGPEPYGHMQGWYLLSSVSGKKMNQKHPYHNEAVPTLFVWAGDFFHHAHLLAGYHAESLVLILTVDPRCC